jgi:hypothetical protein
MSYASTIHTIGGRAPGSIPLQAHRHIKSVTAEIELQLDGTVRSVGILYTDLTLSRFSPGYDANAVEELVSIPLVNTVLHAGE